MDFPHEKKNDNAVIRSTETGDGKKRIFRYGPWSGTGIRTEEKKELTAHICLKPPSSVN